MRWAFSGKMEIHNHVIYYTGEDSAQHGNGVEMIISKCPSPPKRNYKLC